MFLSKSHKYNLIQREEAEDWIYKNVLGEITSDDLNEQKTNEMN